LAGDDDNDDNALSASILTLSELAQEVRMLNGTAAGALSSSADGGNSTTVGVGELSGPQMARGLRVMLAGVQHSGSSLLTYVLAQDRNSFAITRPISAWSVPAPYEIKVRTPQVNVYIATSFAPSPKISSVKDNTNAAMTDEDITKMNKQSVTRQINAVLNTYKPTARILIIRHPAWILSSHHYTSDPSRVISGGGGGGRIGMELEMVKSSLEMLESMFVRRRDIGFDGTFLYEEV
jgi:hypothetical protein